MTADQVVPWILAFVIAAIFVVKWAIASEDLRVANDTIDALKESLEDCDRERLQLASDIESLKADLVSCVNECGEWRERSDANEVARSVVKDIAGVVRKSGIMKSIDSQSILESCKNA